MRVISIAECSEHSAILSIFINLPFDIKIYVLSILCGHLRQVLLYHNKRLHSGPVLDCVCSGKGRTASRCRLSTTSTILAWLVEPAKNVEVNLGVSLGIPYVLLVV